MCFRCNARALPWYNLKGRDPDGIYPHENGDRKNASAGVRVKFPVAILEEIRGRRTSQTR
jgi:hypothetical protein